MNVSTRTSRQSGHFILHPNIFFMMRDCDHVLNNKGPLKFWISAISPVQEAWSMGPGTVKLKVRIFVRCGGGERGREAGCEWGLRVGAKNCHKQQTEKAP